MKPASVHKLHSNAGGAGIGASGGALPDFELIELFFFSYRDFVGEPDRVLAKHGFGRAHHRVLHFVSRHQGLTVAELLDILEITKQSLARVLKELVSAGFIEQRAGVEDRRQRLLFLTVQGKALAEELATMQGRRVARALATLPREARATIVRFLEQLVDDDQRSLLPKGTTGKV